MKHKTTRTWAAMLAALLVLSLMLTACGTGGDTPTGDNSTPDTSSTPVGADSTPDNTPSGEVINEGTYEGTYEGEKDANGKRSGYGVWVYHNFRYEGYWENDMPNGEGTLYEGKKPPEGTETFYISIQGYWVDGFASGEIKYRQHYTNSRIAMTWRFDVATGYPINDETIYVEDGNAPLQLSKNCLMAGVPPWGNVGTDSTIDAPQGNSFTPPPNTTNKTYDEPVVLLPDPPNLSEEYLARIHKGTTINALGGATVVDNMIDEAYEKYGKYLNENISKLCVKVGLYTKAVSIDEDASSITPEALNKVNDFLGANGEEPLGQEDPKEKIAALWLAASLYFDPDYYDKDPYLREEVKPWRHDIAMAFALAKYPSPTEITDYADIYMSEPHKDIKNYRDMHAGDYAHLFNLE